MNPKIQKLKSEKEKLLAKKASIEARCDEIDAQVMELENLDIIGTVREMGIMKMSIQVQSNLPNISERRCRERTIFQRVLS